ncbi:MAG: cation:proton antiporter [Planctomycetota bacterium]
MRSVCRILAVLSIVWFISIAPQLQASEPAGGEVHAAAEEHGEAHGEAHGEGHGITHNMMFLALQLGVILIAAKLMGEFTERVVKMPAVLGELAAGLIIGPYALGGLAIPGLGDALFPASAAASEVVPVSEVIYGVSTFASIVLLFLAGLETDFRQFMRYAGPGGLVGLGGVLGAFVTGDVVTVLFGQALGYEGWTFMSGVPLFMGTISVATSVGITARVLSEKGSLDTPEGVTILAGAVIDDVLGIIVLAMVVAMHKAGDSGEVDWGNIGIIAAKAFGIWLVATAVMIVAAGPLKRFFGILKGDGVVPGVALGIALILSGIMESFGLAMIIGAYVCGLGFAKEKELAHRLDRLVRPMYNLVVPVFFCVMGMLVNFEAMGAALTFGLIFSGIAVVSKVVGCGLPTFLVGFNMKGALRIGFGMLPRGEVALIVAGIGLSSGIIGQDMFGVSILMTLITTVLAPPILVKLFDGMPGRRGEVAPDEPVREVIYRTAEMPRFRREVLLSSVIAALQTRDDVAVSQVVVGQDIYLVSLSDPEFDFEVVEAGETIEVHASEADREQAQVVMRRAVDEVRASFDHLGEPEEE